MKKVKWKNVFKIVDISMFIYCCYTLIHNAIYLCNGWTLTWLGVYMTTMSILYISIFIEENEKVLKGIVQKALRVLGVNNIFTTKLYHKTNKNAKGGF